MTTIVGSKMAIRIGKTPFRIYTLKKKCCLTINNVIFLCSQISSDDNVVYPYP